VINFFSGAQLDARMLQQEIIRFKYVGQRPLLRTDRVAASKNPSPQYQPANYRFFPDRAAREKERKGVLITARRGISLSLFVGLFVFGYDEGRILGRSNLLWCAKESEEGR